MRRFLFGQHTFNAKKIKYIFKGKHIVPKANSVSMNKHYQGKNVLVTGGNGFIGINIIKELINYGANIYALDIRNNNIVKHKNVRFLNCDIKNYQKLKRNIIDISPEIIFHLAAFIDRDLSYANIMKMIRVNLNGTVNVIESQNHNKRCRSIIIAGTCEEYGEQKSKYREYLKESPVSPYSFSKVCVSYLCKLAVNNYNLPIVILRPSLAYGPGQSGPMFIPAIINKLIRNQKFKMTLGEQKRDFIYISDLVNAYLIAGSKKNISGEIINIGSGKSYKIRYIAKLIAGFLKKDNLIAFGAKKYRSADIMNYQVDISKARKLLNWRPIITLPDGISRTIRSYSDVV